MNTPERLCYRLHRVGFDGDDGVPLVPGPKPPEGRGAPWEIRDPAGLKVGEIPDALIDPLAEAFGRIVALRSGTASGFPSALSTQHFPSALSTQHSALLPSALFLRAALVTAHSGGGAEPKWALVGGSDITLPRARQEADHLLGAEGLLPEGTLVRRAHLVIKAPWPTPKAVRVEAEEEEVP